MVTRSLGKPKRAHSALFRARLQYENKQVHIFSGVAVPAPPARETEPTWAEGGRRRDAGRRETRKGERQRETVEEKRGREGGKEKRSRRNAEGGETTEAEARRAQGAKGFQHEAGARRGEGEERATAGNVTSLYLRKGTSR